VADYDDPVAIARQLGAAARPTLIGLDVDGVLAPIVAHADDATLLAGMGAAISAVASLVGVDVAVVSGRSLDGLAQFDFGRDVHVIGSHGLESRDSPMAPLSATEQARLAVLDDAARICVARAGTGAWIERKPASVVLHVRQADSTAGAVALAELADRVEQVDGATIKAGDGVLEAFARHGDKGTALVELAGRLGTATTVFVGDDLTDEDAFAQLADRDVTIKVGDADTIARHRLRDPRAVLALLQAIPTTFASRSR
jgi:trehalose-phosphatase